MAPSVQWKIDAHARLINQLTALMPITKIVLETGTFDPHKLKDPSVKNHQYQKGVQYGFGNAKAYVLARDGYTCQCGKRGCTDKLEVHHIVFRSEGGSDAPENLITLCSKHLQNLNTGETYTGRLAITGNHQLYLPTEIQKMLEGSGRIRIQLV